MAALTPGAAFRVPGDKSISHRALICAAIGAGQSRIRGILESADVQSTATVLRSLGAAVPTLGADIVVRGGVLREATHALDCGNSGTTARLVAGVAAGCRFSARFEGDASLSRRPMLRIARPLTAMGAAVELSAGNTLPMRVTGGPLRPIDWTSDRASAQVKSAILLAGLVGGVVVSVGEPAKSRDHTERMLRALGVSIDEQGSTVRLVPPPSLAPIDIEIPGDPSSAAFLAAIAALAGGGAIAIEQVCLNPTRTGFFRVLARMGATVSLGGGTERVGEPVGTIVVAPGALRGTTVGASEVPAMIDELPLVACLGACAAGETVVTGAEELRVKESDRVAVVVENLRRIGVEAEELPDGFRVVGSDTPLRGRITTHGDHRIAMAFGVLGSLPGNDISIDDPDCCTVSFPGFWEQAADVVRVARDG